MSRVVFPLDFDSSSSSPYPKGTVLRCTRKTPLGQDVVYGVVETDWTHWIVVDTCPSQCMVVDPECDQSWTFERVRGPVKAKRR